MEINRRGNSLNLIVRARRAFWDQFKPHFHSQLCSKIAKWVMAFAFCPCLWDTLPATKPRSLNANSDRLKSYRCIWLFSFKRTVREQTIQAAHLCAKKVLPRYLLCAARSEGLKGLP